MSIQSYSNRVTILVNSMDAKAYAEDLKAAQPLVQARLDDITRGWREQQDKTKSPTGNEEEFERLMRTRTLLQELTNILESQGGGR